MLNKLDETINEVLFEDKFLDEFGSLDVLVLDFEDYQLDQYLDRAIDEAIEEENLDYLDVPCVYGNWCGPGCSGPAPPVDGIDRCCQAHDRCYGRRGYFACSCDRDLVKCLAPYSARSRAAKIMGTYFKYSPCRPWA